MNNRRYVIVTVVAAALGFVFAAFSTHDFVQHLDREVHAIHCSFIPGVVSADASGSSGCQVTMMSPYSSIFRTSIWGGVPISLPAMGVFGFLLFWGVEILMSRRHDDRRAVGLLALGYCVPAAASLVMGTIAFASLEAACKLCIGIYLSSAAGLAAAFLLWREVSGKPVATAAIEGEGAEFQPQRAQLGKEQLRLVLGGAVAAVILPMISYVAAVPDHRDEVASCGALEWSQDSYGVMVPLGGRKGGVPAIEILDPLCPSCRAFEERFMSSGVSDQFARQAVLFPLDNTCNWMVESAVHPGACAVSEAVICAGPSAPAVLDWAFEHQAEIREAASKDPEAAARMAAAKFPKLKGCIGSAQARTKLNKSLRWAVRNQIQVLTPQFYVAGVKLCDEDVDLGLDFALTTMLDMHAKGTLPVPLEKLEPPPPPRRSPPLAEAARPAKSAEAQPEPEAEAEDAPAGEAAADDSAAERAPAEAPEGGAR